MKENFSGFTIIQRVEDLGANIQGDFKTDYYNRA